MESLTKILRIFLFSLLTASAVIMNSCHDMKHPADLIIYNANIYTCDSAFSVAQAVAIKDGLIISLGTTDYVLSRYGSDDQINAKGKYVYPGFIDAHSHFYGLANMQRYADLSGAGSFEEVISIIRQWHTDYPSEWILGFGWDQNKWPGKQFPSNSLLDKHFPGVPILLTRIDGHAVLASTEAINRSQLGVIPQGEAIYNNGKLTGVFLESTADKIKAAVPQISEMETESNLMKASELCYAAGLTSVTDAGLDAADIQRLRQLQDAKKLLLRINVMLNPTEENFEKYLSKGIITTPVLTIRSIKLYADGALGSRGACLRKPYTDDPGTKGMMVISENKMEEFCKKAFDAGFQVCTHAIGDSAVGFVLRQYAGFLKGKNDRRWRIEHAQVVDPQDIDLFGDFNIVPSIQATHATSDMGWADERLGARIKYAYAYKQLLRQNGWLPNGTDFPIEAIDPLKTFYASVARKNNEGKPAMGFQSENALSRIEALKSMTIWAARASFDEKAKGSIEAGKFGDLVIMDQDLMKVSEDQLLKTTILYTVIGGKVVYDSAHQPRQ